MINEKVAVKSRRLQRGHGVTGVSIDLSLTHMYHISALKEEALKFKAEYEAGNENIAHAQFIIAEMTKILTYFCQEDFPHPMDPNLWDIPVDNKL